jgi:hypothetical protein
MTLCLLHAIAGPHNDQNTSSIKAKNLVRAELPTTLQLVTDLHRYSFLQVASAADASGLPPVRLQG